MNYSTVVRLKDVSIYHADDPFGNTSPAKIVARGELVLANIDLTISAGEFVYLIGRVGSG